MTGTVNISLPHSVAAAAAAAAGQPNLGYSVAFRGGSGWLVMASTVESMTLSP